MSPTPLQAVLAIDLGTTQAKAGIVTLDGRPLAIARAAYPIQLDGDRGRAEQDPEDWWSAICRMTAELLAVAGSVDIMAVCADGQGPTLVVVDETSRPVVPALSWLDTRSAVDERALEAATGQRGFVLGILPKARWFERNGPPGAVRAARHYLASWEWIAMRMTGAAAETSRAGQIHPDRERVRIAGVSVDRLPPSVPAGSVIGRLTVEAAVDLGLAGGIPVVAGLADAYASFIGAGLLEAGDAVDTGGTSGGFAVYVDRPVEIPGVFGSAAPLPDRWLLGGAMNATGKALEWLRDDLLRGRLTTDELLAGAAGIAPGADGLVFLPYLAGERSPIWDPEARGAFAGLSLKHGRDHLARAILEAADLALRHVASPILAAGVPVRELRVSGAMARQRTWNRVKADVTGFTVAVPSVVETAMVGSAIVAATGVGAFADLATGIRAMVTIDERIEPDPAHRAIYDRLYETYVDLYPALKPTFARLASLGRSVRSPER